MKALFHSDTFSRHMNIGSEMMFVSPIRRNIFLLKSTPLSRVNLAYGDQVICTKREINDNLLSFLRIYMPAAFSTFRIFRTDTLNSLNYFHKIMEDIQKMGCGVSVHGQSGVAGVSVPFDIKLNEVLCFARRRLGSEFFVEVTANRQGDIKCPYLFTVDV